MNPTERILTKLAQCAPYRERLIELRGIVIQGRATWIEWSAVERNLQLALECAIDVGEMLIATRGWPRPEENRDVFRVLGENGVLDEDLAARMMRAAGLRNLLVHQYGTIDRDKLAKVLENDVGDLDLFAQAVARSIAPP